jgi:UDP-glucuronate 4-epimerase
MPGPRREHVVVTGAAGFIGSHLAEAQAAQPGVRNSFGQGFAVYLHNNVLATQRLLEWCVRAEVPRLVFASSSSVYGDAPSYPTTEESRTRPLSPYGVTKLAAEQLCQAYAQASLSGMTVAILRYFTVYRPRQRPDMAFRRFIEAAGGSACTRPWS